MLLKSKQKIVFVGDSITDCDRQKPDGEGSPVSNPFGHGYVSLLFAYLHSQYPKLHIRIINQGISGNTSRDICNRYDEILDLQPDWIFLMIGVNDVWRHFDSPEISSLHVDIDSYRNNILDIINRTKKIKAELIILSPFMIENNLEDIMRKKLQMYQNVLKEITTQYSIRYIDIQKAFDNLLTYITTHEISRDRIHPNTTGHMLIMKEILKYLENN